MMVTVEQIVEAGQLIEAELRAQATRLKEVLPRDEDEAIYLTDLMDGYEKSAVYVNRLWTHQKKRLDKLAHVQAGTSNGVAQAVLEDG